jgi:fatty-acyl-CoA synthase
VHTAVRQQRSPSWAVHEHYVLRLLWSLTRRPDEIVLRWQGHSMTRWELSGRIVRAASALHGHGIGTGQTVAVLTRINNPEMLIARYAAHLIGATVVYVHSANPRGATQMLPEQVQAQILRNTAARVLVIDHDHLTRAQTVAGVLGGSLVLAASGFDADGVLRLDADSESPVRSISYRPDDTAIITFTSGTTGRPKGIAQPYRAWNATIRSFASTTDPASPATFLAVTPLSYTIGSMIDSVVIGGGRVVLRESFDAAGVLSSIETERATDTYLAVPHLYQLLDHPRITTTDLSSLRRVIYSGSPAASHRIAAATERLPDCLHQLYGSTECGGISSLTPADHRQPDLLGTVGRPLPGVTLGVFDPDTGHELSPALVGESGAVGEIRVRARTVMSRYLTDTAESAGDDWLHTGDLGYLDSRGYLTLTGRLADVIKSGGHKIYPAPIEALLMSHPAIKHAAVYGVEDGDRREHIHAAIVLRPGAHCSDQDLAGVVAYRLSAAHVPAKFHRWPELPLTSRGKPDVAQLRSHSARRLSHR